VVICLERGADLHTAQLMPLPLTVSCSSKIQIGLTFLVLAHLGSPGKRAVKRVCVFVCVLLAKKQPFFFRHDKHKTTVIRDGVVRAPDRTFSSDLSISQVTLVVARGVQTPGPPGLTGTPLLTVLLPASCRIVGSTHVEE